MSHGGDHPGAPGSADLERIIERGLQLYGVGDVDAALAMWEQALALDPDDVRAAAYVDYVRENYSMLAETPSAPEDEVPFGLGAVPGDPDDEYEVEVTGADAPPRPRAAAAPIAPVERYIEAVDEGWFINDELPPALDLGPPDDGLGELDFGDAPPSRPSRQLPLPANPSELTLELEADEPGADEVGQRGFDAPAPGDDDDQTGDFGRGGAWPRAANGDGLAAPVDFIDQKSAVPTQEIASPRGFVRSRLAPVASAAESAEGLAAVSAAAPAGDEADHESDDDDRLRTRPGRATGGPLEVGGPPPLSVAPDLLSGLGGEFGGGTGTGQGGRAIGPDERTRELPHVRVTFNPDSNELPAAADPLDAPELDERTTERSSAGRFDTSSETTIERGSSGSRYTRPAPIDDGPISGRHPPLVIIEDPVLADAPAGPRVPPGQAHDDAHDDEPDRSGDAAGEYDLHPGTAKVRRVASARQPAVAPGPVSVEDLAHALEDALAAAAPAGESPADRTRRRVSELLDRAVAASTSGDHATAIVALDLALRDDPDSAIAQKLVHRHQPAILDVYQRFLGDLSARPTLAMPMHELSDQKLDIRAAFLLSRIDGALTFEEILDVSGMQRGEAFRHLSVLLLRGILAVR